MSIDRRRFLVGSAAAAFLAACSKGAKRLAGVGTTSSTDGVGSGSAPSSFGSTSTSGSSAATGPALYVPNGSRSGATAALTFHGSGDISLAQAMLDKAAARHVPITVFAVGQWLEQNPTMAKRILDGGHELANHTYTHPTLGRVARPGVATEITRCRDVLLHLAGNNGAWFRPSGVEGVPSQLILEEAGVAGYRTAVGFDVDPLDYTDPGADAIVTRTAAKLRAGSIVSLHLGHPGTVAAFDRIVDNAENAGIGFVTVSTLLGRTS